MSPLSDIDTRAVESLKALNPDRPIREADMAGQAGWTGVRRHAPKYAGLLCTTRREFCLQYHSLRHVPRIRPKRTDQTIDKF
jgi:hypothetical protein